MNDRFGHAAKYRLDYVQELRTGRQWCQLDHWTRVRRSILRRVDLLNLSTELLGRVPRRRIPREVDAGLIRILCEQNSQELDHLICIFPPRVKMGHLVFRQSRAAVTISVPLLSW